MDKIRSKKLQGFDGAPTHSSREIRTAFCDFFESLLGTDKAAEADCSPGRIGESKPTHDTMRPRVRWIAASIPRHTWTSLPNRLPQFTTLATM